MKKVYLSLFGYFFFSVNSNIIFFPKKEIRILNSSLDFFFKFFVFRGEKKTFPYPRITDSEKKKKKIIKNKKPKFCVSPLKQDRVIIRSHNLFNYFTKRKEAFSTFSNFTNFLENWLSYSLKCLFQQNNQINALIWRIFWNNLINFNTH